MLLIINEVIFLELAAIFFWDKPDLPASPALAL